MVNNVLTLCTYNVHGFFDAHGNDNIERVITIVKWIQADVLCFQVEKLKNIPALSCIRTISLFSEIKNK